MLSCNWNVRSSRESEISKDFVTINKSEQLTGGKHDKINLYILHAGIGKTKICVRFSKKKKENVPFVVCKEEKSLKLSCNFPMNLLVSQFSKFLFDLWNDVYTLPVMYRISSFMHASEVVTVYGVWIKSEIWITIKRN
jgi:hypothetical protein